MNRNPLSSNASRFAADSIPALAATTMSRAAYRSRKRVNPSSVGDAIRWTADWDADEGHRDW